MFKVGMRVRIKAGHTVLCSNCYSRNIEECTLRQGDSGRVMERGTQFYVQFTRGRKLNIDARMLEGSDESLEVLP